MKNKYRNVLHLAPIAAIVIVAYCIGYEMGGIANGADGKVHAQLFSQQLAIGSFSGSQYVLTVYDQRGMGRFDLRQVPGTACQSSLPCGIDIDEMPRVGSGAAVMFQGYETGARNRDTFTVNVQEP